MLIAPHFFTEPSGLAAIAEIGQGLYVRRPARKARALARRCRTPSSAGATPGSIRQFREWDISEYLAYIRVPVLIVQGTDDQYGTVKQIETAQQECYCPVEVAMMKGARHTPQRETPDQVLAAMSDFVARVLRANEWVKAA